MASTATLTLEPSPEAIAAARQAVTDAVRGRINGERLDVVRLLVSEIVTNSVRHSRTRASLELAMCVDGHVSVAVTDHGVGFAPEARVSSLDDPGGWGLYLVEELSARWGVVHNGGTCVWFALAAQ